ncbi:VOC family protein [Enterococcus casseliflavus]|uniref:VOC family protein n=1 Tax=Enterococcus casseliflavus TaxID=37734 RepID=UPI00115CAA48|nr:VOC family protein [Enterococcus casseliflavus]MDT2980026.1 VOC family protein [Enterococcus casseliflavus]MDY2548475.1 VOC family protein [Enterococcus casseliflavus]
MFSNQMQVMLYVDDVTKAVEFWQELGFVIIEQQTVDGTSVVEIAPLKEAEAHFVLYDREFIETHSPEVALNSPSIMFFAEDITTLYKKLLEMEAEVGELIQMEEQLVFNFADPDGNYFAVSGK